MIKWEPDVSAFEGPKYRALVAALEMDINAGKLKPGDRLPPQRDLATTFGVTIATVTKAIAEARQRGLVTAVKGSGTFISEPKDKEPKPQGLIDLSLNIVPTSVVAEELNRALDKSLREDGANRLFSFSSYSDEGGRFADGLDWLATVGFRPFGDTVTFPCHGGQHGILAALSTLAGPGDTILCEAQTYTGMLRIAEQLGQKAVGVELDDEGIVPDALEKAFAETNAKVVFIIPTLQNPTGVTMSEARRRQVADICVRYDAFIIEDETQLPLAGVGLPLLSSFAPDNIVVITGFSKCLAAGIRLGYASVPRKIGHKFHEALVASGWLAPTLYPNLIGKMVQDGSLDACLMKHKEEASARLELAYSVFGDAVGKINQHSYHLWLNIGPAQPVDALVEIARVMGVKIVSAKHFCCANVEVPQAIRLCLGAVEDCEMLSEGLQLLRRTLADPGRDSDIVF